MPRADLTIRLHIDRITPYLRADEIRTTTLTTLATAMTEDPKLRTDLIDLLDELGAAVTGRTRDGEQDALIGDIEDLADMGRAQMQLTRVELDQLAREAAGAVNTLTPKGLPSQREAGAA